MPILSVKNLYKSFSTRTYFWSKPLTFVAVNNISFDLHKGEILGLLGANGAGKTTTIQMLLGTLTATSGSIRYFGKDFFSHGPEILQDLGCASGYDKLPGTLTVRQNLDIFARLYGIPHSFREQRISQMLKDFDMADKQDRKTATLSAGQATRLLLAKAFLSSPKIALLDEPTASLDPTIATQVRKYVMQQAREHGTSVLFSSHNMEEVTQVCDRVLVMKSGNIIADNTPKQLAATIKVAHVRLFVTEKKEQLLQLLRERALPFTVDEHTVSIEIDEGHISSLLGALGQQEISYATISIDKPTLEDYFLSVS